MSETLALMGAGFLHAIAPVNLFAMLASTIIGITIGGGVLIGVYFLHTRSAQRVTGHCFGCRNRRALITEYFTDSRQLFHVANRS